MAQTTDSKFSHLPLAASGPIKCPYKGLNVLTSSYFNKGSAFPDHERKDFELEGLLPPNVQTLEEQVERAYQQYSRRGSDDLGKNTFMASMKAQNEVLYYKLLQTHLKEMSSVIYTPTEGEAIQNYSRLFRKPEGIFLNILDQDKIERTLGRRREEGDIDYIVVTDGEEILGIGDQGVGGILISVAKLVLTTVCAGIHPARQLPVVLDCGTDNEELLKDELYLGLRRRRIRGTEYDNFVNSFVRAARKHFPSAYVHFEDFGISNARRILDQYQPHIPCFNDDIQGTGCVTLAATMVGLRISEIEFADMRLVVFGSGSAGIGIADQVRDAIAAETGKSKEQAALQIWCLDKPGLLLKSHGKDLTPGQERYARDATEWEGSDLDLLSVIEKVKPHVLIGTSTKPKAFSEEIVKEMSKHVDRPIVFPLSNPTHLHEADPKDIYKWTEGKALIATGSPFPPVVYEGIEYEVAECNNSTCFPGIGLGVILSRARLLSEKMLVAAVKALADRSPALKDPNRGLLPDIVDVREVSVHIAAAVIRRAVDEGLAQTPDIPLGGDGEDLKEWIQAQMWDPVYRPLVRAQ
ncbi:NAD-dependent malic enzyme, mitochondrial [Arachnomyces sp. PD_36]|nr:NAD-dependent malic enzyme, mitochondrial [Arachnomyces sp. PD_36]